MRRTSIRLEQIQETIDWNKGDVRSHINFWTR